MLSQFAHNQQFWIACTVLSQFAHNGDKKCSHNSLTINNSDMNPTKNIFNTAPWLVYSTQVHSTAVLYCTRFHTTALCNIWLNCTELSVNRESAIPAVVACEKLSNHHKIQIQCSIYNIQCTTYNTCKKLSNHHHCGCHIRLKTNKEFVCCAATWRLSITPYIFWACESSLKVTHLMSCITNERI